MPPPAQVPVLTRIAPGLTLALIALIGFAGPFWACGSGAQVPFIYQVEPPKVSAKDLSGEVGERLLRLLGIRAKKHLDWVRKECKTTGQGGDELLSSQRRLFALG